MLKWMLKKVNNKKGFTLIELIVVIAILGILAAIAVPRYVASQENAKKAAAEATVRTLNGAVAMFLANEGDESDLTGADGAEEAYGILVGAEVMLDTVTDFDKIDYTPADMVFSVK